MQDTGIYQEIETLREQIALAEATTIARHKGRISARCEPGVSSVEDVELREIVEARNFMVARLSRLQSCKRTSDV